MTSSPRQRQLPFGLAQQPTKWKRVYTNESSRGKLAVMLTPERDAVLIAWQHKSVVVPRELLSRLRQALEAAEEEI